MLKNSNADPAAECMGQQETLYLVYFLKMATLIALLAYKACQTRIKMNKNSSVQMIMSKYISKFNELFINYPNF